MTRLESISIAHGRVIPLGCVTVACLGWNNLIMPGLKMNRNFYGKCPVRYCMHMHPEHRALILIRLCLIMFKKRFIISVMPCRRGHSCTCSRKVRPKASSKRIGSPIAMVRPNAHQFLAAKAYWDQMGRRSLHDPFTKQLRLRNPRGICSTKGMHLVCDCLLGTSCLQGIPSDCTGCGNNTHSLEQLCTTNCMKA